MKRAIFMACSLILTAAIAALAQEYTPRLPFTFRVDFAQFRHSQEDGYLEIYYGFYPQLLTYVNKEGEYAGGLKLWTQIFSQDSSQHLVDEQVSIPFTFQDTTLTSFKYPVVSQAGYFIPNGEYILKIVASDSLNPSRTNSLQVPFTVAPYADSLCCSDLELCREIKPSQNRENPYYKNSLEVIPNPLLLYGATSHPMLFYYLELYNVAPGQTYLVKTQVLNFNNQVVKQIIRKQQYPAASSVGVGMLNTTTIPSGQYIFQYTLLSPDSSILLTQRKNFFVYNPQLEPALTSTSLFNRAELNALSVEEMDREFEYARYLTSDEEKQLYKQIHTTEGKRQMLAKLWASAALGRLDYPPIARKEYLNRVREANEQFTKANKEGWETDRGRVYILYGKPDFIERNPNISESKPYEIWHYYSIENGVIFVFADRLGYGYLELVHSTKRGEFRDDDWQRFIH